MVINIWVLCKLTPGVHEALFEQVVITGVARRSIDTQKISVMERRSDMHSARYIVGQQNYLYHSRNRSLSQITYGQDLEISQGCASITSRICLSE